MNEQNEVMALKARLFDAYEATNKMQDVISAIAQKLGVANGSTVDDIFARIDELKGE